MLSRLEHLSPGSSVVGGQYPNARLATPEGAYAPVSFVTFTSTVIPRKFEALPE